MIVELEETGDPNDPLNYYSETNLTRKNRIGVTRRYSLV